MKSAYEEKIATLEAIITVLENTIRKQKEDINRLLRVNSTYKDQAIRYSNRIDELENQIEEMPN